MSYQTVIFDLDGTLLDTLDDLTSAVNYALSRFSLPKRDREEVRSFVGNGQRKLLERASEIKYSQTNYCPFLGNIIFSTRRIKPSRTKVF
jgi:phosphoglycolate phosphatase-like HAD superfamily hydrolase